MSRLECVRVFDIGYNRSAQMADEQFPRLVSLACHDLRTPLATVYGFARTLTRMEDLDERTARFLGMIEEAAEQMTELLDDLGTVARIEGGRWEPGLREADTLELARTDDERVAAEGTGETIETEAESVARGLRALAIAAARFGPAERVTWVVSGRELALAPVTAEAAPVVLGESMRDLGSLVARAAIEALGGSLGVDGETLRVRL
jgi:signal transduction histidine kinase